MLLIVLLIIPVVSFIDKSYFRFPFFKSIYNQFLSETLFLFKYKCLKDLFPSLNTSFFNRLFNNYRQLYIGNYIEIIWPYYYY